MKIQAPDGGFYEFPDDAKDSEIEDFINQQHPSPEQAISFAAQMGSTIPAKVAQMMEAGALAAPGAREAAEQQRFEKANPYAQAQLQAGQQIGPMGPVDPYDILRLPELLTIPGKVMEPIAQASEDIFSDFLKNTPAAGAIGMARDALNIQPEPGKPLIPVGRIPSALGMVSDALTRTGAIEPNRFTEFLKGSEEAAGRTAEGFLTPGQIPMLAAAPGSKLLQGLFAAQAAAEVPESVRQIIESKSPQELGSAVTGAAANLGMAAMMGHALLKGESPYAGRVKEATEVHGDLRSQPGKGPGEVSTQESGAGIFPLPEDLGQATQVLLRQGQENNQRLGLGHQIQVLDNFGSHDPDNIRPFRADMPAPDGTPGRIQMSREGLKNWLATIPKDRQAQAVQTALAEEGIHSTVLPEIAVQYLGTLTPAERAIGEKLYLGPHTWDELGVDPAVRPLLVGHELLRQRMQRLLRMEPTEIQEVVGREKWTKQSVEMIARVIRRIRELAGTKAAKAGTEITDQLLRQYESRINSAAKVVGMPAPFPERSDKGEELGGEEPFMINRTPQELREEKEFELLHRNWVPTLKPWRQEALRKEVEKGQGGMNIESILEDEEPEAVRRGQRYYELAHKLYGRHGEVAPQEAPKLSYRQIERYVRKGKMKEPPALISRNEPTHESDMDFARRVVKMTPEEFTKEAKSFNRINLRLGQRASEADVTELKKLRDEAIDRFNEAFKKAKADPSEKNVDEIGRLGSMPQFFNEAIAEAEKAKPAAINRHFWIRPRSDGVHDILDAVQELGGLKPPGKRAGGEYDAWKESMTGTARLLVNRQAKHAPDTIIGELHSMGGWQRIQTPDQLFEAISQASKARRKLAETGGTPEMQTERFWKAAEKPGDKRGLYKVNIQTLKEGDVFYLRGEGISNEPLTVTHVDPNTGDVQVKDGPKLGVQNIPDNTEIYLRKGMTQKSRVQGWPRVPKGEAQPEQMAAALSRKKGEPEPELFLPPIAGPAERTGTGFIPAAKDFENETMRHLTESAAPNFATFLKEAKQKLGDLQPGAARDVWQTQVWKRLMAAAPEELKRMARNMGLDKYIPGGEMAGPEKSPKASQFSLKGEIIDPEAAKEANTLEVAGNERMREELARRYSLIATLGQKLIGQAQTGKRAWARDLINPEEIADPKIETKQPVYHEISPAAQSDVKALGAMLTDDARAFGGAKITKTADGQKVTIQQKGLPVSVTKRVTAIQDKTTGRVSLVSTFRDGRRGAVLLDPQSPKQTHSTLDSILNRYRVISSALLDEPVKDFREDFRTLKEFQDHFGEPARRAAEKFAGYEEPAKEQAPEEYTPPTFDQPITDSEASSIIDHLEGEVGTFEGPDDVLLAIEGLKENPNRQAASAYGKLASELQKKNPDLSTEDLLKKLAKQIYEDHTASKTLEDFQRRTMEKGPAPDRGTLGTKVQAEGAKLQEPSKATPAVLTRQKQELKDQWTLLKRAIATSVKRRSVKASIPAMLDGAEGTSNQFALNSGNHIRAQAKDVKVREAAVALIAAGDIEKPGSLLAGQWFANPKFLPQLFQHLDNGEIRARQWLLERNPVRKVYARQWLKAIEHMREGLRYAQDHWNDPDLQDVALAVRKELKDTIDWENANGSNVQERQNHYPGRYEGEFWSDNGLNFGSKRLLGTQYRYPKKFANPYDAISKGPYIQASYDPADVVEHRVRVGHRIVEQKMWEEAVKGIRDPDGKNIAKDPVPYTVEVKDPRTGEITEEQRWKSPGPEYELIKPFGWQKPMAVLSGYTGLIESVTAKSQINKLPLAKEALAISSILKHGFILVADTFHIGRVGQYAAALLGLGKVGFRGGHAALSYRPEDLAAAVHQGYITQAAADWAMEPVKVKVMRRRPTATGWTNVTEETTMTRHDLGRELISQGLNAAKISDALYKDVLQNVPFIGKGWHKLIGPFNDFLFGRFMPGLIMETAVRNFEKYNTAHPDIPVNRLMRDVIKDTNVFYGNMGRQGVFRSATFRDYAQIFLLAPLWQEGLIQKEVRFAGRLTGISALTGRRGLPYMGTLGSGMANGLLTYFALSQLVNLITRRQFTWQNDEKGHKLDAWIPTGDGKGFWLSPLTTFAEVTHDIIRLAETKPTTFDALMQLGSNRLGPIGKMGYILTTGTSPTGEQYSTSRGRLAGGIGQVVPFVGPGPISFSGPARVAAHALFPEQVKPAPRGTLIRQGLASLAGIKVQPGDTAVQMVSRAAEDFVKKEGLKKSTGWKQVQTDEPSYSKLRAAVRNDDPKGIKEQYHALLKDRTQDEIVRAMQNWGKRGFTGSNEGEMRFVGSLNDRELELYNQALKEKNDTLEKFIDWLTKQP